ncbi:MAG: hypothetical protein ABSE56_12425 [Bryobacteraceae bacterium]|jgi:hypothetical protein
MARLRYRWLLPLGHALVDVVLLTHFVWQGNQWRSVTKAPCAEPAVAQPGAPAEDGGVGWDPKYMWVAPRWDFRLLASGTAPAGLISLAIRPRADWQNCSRLWDPVWFAIHEAIALLFWFLIGAGLDRPRAPLRKMVGVYLGFRIASVFLCWTRWAPLGTYIQALFWLTFSVCALVYACRRLLPRIRVHT